MVRPKKIVDWNKIVKKMEAGCTAREIYSALDTKMTKDTFYNKFKAHFGCSFQDYHEQASLVGLGDLKCMLHQKAMKGNITALIFLARCRLGMKEPENNTLIATNQNQIDQSHEIMRLENRIAELENAHKPKTE